MRLDGAEIEQWSRAELGPYLGYLPQDIELFEGTIAENIARFGDVDSEKVIDAARLAGIHEMILHMPDGYDTRLDPRAFRLSGGQKQRVAIARALIGKPKVILADEPTGALDSATSSEVMDLLREVNASGITVLIVTHEQDIARRTSRTIRISDGMITEIVVN